MISMSSNYEFPSKGLLRALMCSAMNLIKFYSHYYESFFYSKKRKCCGYIKINANRKLNWFHDDMVRHISKNTFSQSKRFAYATFHVEFSMDNFTLSKFNYANWFWKCLRLITFRAHIYVYISPLPRSTLNSHYSFHWLSVWFMEFISRFGKSSTF